MESKQICSACRNLTPAAKEGYGNGTLSISFNDARQASITCSFCKYLLQVVLHLLPSLHNWQLSISCEEYENGRRKIYLSVWLRKEGHDIQIRIGIFGIRGKPNPLNLPISKYRPSENTGSIEATRTVLKLIKDCALKHSLCNPRMAAPLPNRTLEIGPAADIVFLRETKGQTNQYICLSYCWGEAQKILTTRSTIKSHKSGIPICNLPRTFQDAIIFSRRLGVHYIWIDALCILQDDLHDWEMEAANMSKYYGGSYLTLAATASSDADGGLFLNNQVFASFQDCSGELHYLVAKRIADRDILFYPFFWRGWIYQERILSPRVLHFADGLYFECRKHVVDESYQLQSGRCWSVKTSFWESVSRTELADNASYYEGTDLELSWHQIVEEYCRLKLTKATDKFPAIAGLVNVLKTIRDAEYVAGLWMDTLISDLLWYYEGYDPPNLMPWRAPSWSWASLDGDISYYDTTQGPSRGNHNVHLDNVDCSVVKARYNTASLFSAKQDQKFILELYGPVEFYVSISQAEARYKVHRDGGRHFSYGLDSDDEDACYVTVEVVIPARYSVCGPVKILWLGYRSLYKQHFGLILSKVTGEEEVYQRVGCAISKGDLTQEYPYCLLSIM